MTGVARAGRETVWWVGSIVSWLALLAVVALLALTVVVPRVSGGTAYTILTGSMLPTLAPGTMIITQPVPMSELMIGDVITYQFVTDEPAVVTHRITAITYAADGRIAFRTVGDNNGAVDENPVQAGQVRGRVWYAVPYVGYLTSWLSGHTRLAVITAGGLGLVGYAAWMFTAAGRDRRKTAVAAGTAHPAQGIR